MAVCSKLLGIFKKEGSRSMVFEEEEQGNQKQELKDLNE